LRLPAQRRGQSPDETGVSSWRVNFDAHEAAHRLRIACAKCAL